MASEKAGADLTDRADRKTLRILIAEDNAVSQKVAVSLVERLGYSANAVGDGREALEAFSSGFYDVVLMDLYMPNMDGYEATSEIRRREDASNRVLIIALTASALPEDRDRAILAGVDDYLSKPIRAKDLETTLSRWIKEPASSDAKYQSDVLDQGILRKLREIDGGQDLVREMTEAFLEETAGYLVELRRAAERGDSETFRRTAHTLKGSTATMGATALARMIDRIEDRAGNLPSVQPLLSEIEEKFILTSEALLSELEDRSDPT